MRATFLATLLFFSTAAFAETAAAPQLSAEAKNCLECHKAGGDGPTVDAHAFTASVHFANGVDCTSCHEGYTSGPHDGEWKKLTPEEQAVVDRLAKGSWGEGEHKHTLTSPRTFLACVNCHDGEVAAFQKSVHAKWLREDTKVAGATCASCHGAIHAAQPLAKFDPKPGVRENVPADRRAMAAKCGSCHGNEEFSKAAGLNPEVASTYHDSIHGRLVRVGNNFAPSCTNCHAAPLADGGTHAIVSKTDAASMVSATRKQEACARCHVGATANFASLIAHKPVQEVVGHVVPHLIHVGFSWLTTLTLLFFGFHVLVDFIYELRMRLARKPEHAHAADAVKSVLRFDIHQRIQHWLMLTGVILLGITGWPLRGAGVFGGAPLLDGKDAAGYSQAFMKLFGGAEAAAKWHRVGAILIIVSAIYHLFYLTFLAAQKRLPISMLPGPKDALDMRDNLLFMLGLKKERPKFDRYSYLEKFDYMGIFWGVIFMVGTGFIFWYPAWFASWAPNWLISAALIIHGEEATLAILFLFVVHFYNVHLKPSIFPMNWAWLNGRISVEMLKHEHPLEYDRLKSDLEK